MNWADPYHGGAQVADLKEATPYLAFTPVVPRDLGAPNKVVIAGSRPDMSARHLIAVYEQPVYGRFWITESITDITQASIESLANTPTPCSEDSVVKLRSGSKAGLSVVGDRAAYMMWLDHGLRIDLIGQCLTKEKAIELANKV